MFYFFKVKKLKNIIKPENDKRRIPLYMSF